MEKKLNKERMLKKVTNKKWDEIYCPLLPHIEGFKPNGRNYVFSVFEKNAKN